MDEIITATGRHLYTDYLVTIKNPPVMFLRILKDENGFDEEALEQIFKNPEETERITYAGRVYEGYTEFSAIYDESDARKVVLKRGEA